jgi:hypothetical protein
LTINEPARSRIRYASGWLVEQPLQLAFAQIDRSSALDERISELLATSAAHLPQDPLRSLYFANEALLLAESGDLIELELRGLRQIVEALRAAGRQADATPYIVRAIDLADSIHDTDLLSALVEALGTWAIAVEQQASEPAGRRPRSTRDWAVATITRFEGRYPGNATAPPSTREATIDDPDTGLLNSLGMAAELLTLEEHGATYALIQIVLTGHTLALLSGVARSAAQLVGDRGLVARNGPAMLTAILPLFTGIAAMSLAEQMRAAFVRQSADSFARIGIGVAIKQPGESSRDVLRRVADRAEEATFAAGVTVCG